jgi:DNA (cytosine-5)-methyltransferase 1
MSQDNHGVKRLRVLDLFSGIGGISLGLHRSGMTTAAFCEIEPFPRAVLAKNFPGVKIYDDVKLLSSYILRMDGVVGPGRSIDVIAGGFPCQDISVAGKGAGIKEGTRSGLWFEMLRLVREIRPRWVVAENVPALRTRGADRVIADLEESGYSVWASVVGAWAVGAPHKRDRAWIVANCPGERCGEAWGNIERSEERTSGNGQMTDSESQQGGRVFFPGIHGNPGATGSRELVDPQGIGRPREGNNVRGFDNGSGEAMADTEQVRRGTRSGNKGNQVGAELGRGESNHGCGVELANPGGSGWQERHFSSIPNDAGYGSGGRNAWPSRPGEQQHQWEAPRLSEFSVGAATDGVSTRLVRFANRNALKAAGNSVVPQVVELIGRAIMSMEVSNG